MAPAKSAQNTKGYPQTKRNVRDPQTAKNFNMSTLTEYAPTVLPIRNKIRKMPPSVSQVPDVQRDISLTEPILEIASNVKIIRKSL